VNLVVDTSVWSLLLRRKSPVPDNPHLARLRHHLEKPDAIHLPAIVLVELLDGVKECRQFDLLVEYFAAFPVVDTCREDCVEAARLANACRARGVLASSVDFLIAATCIRRGYPLLSADRDFAHIARHCPLVLLPV